MDELVDLSTSRMKNIGASWLICMYQHVSNIPSNIVNSFLAAQIQQSIDAVKPVLSTGDKSDNTSDHETSEDDVSKDDTSEDDTSKDDMSKDDMSEKDTSDYEDNINDEDMERCN